MGNTLTHQLHDSSRKGDIDGIRKAIRAGALVTEAAEPHGWTCLHAAAAYNQEEACRLLFNAKADLMQKSKSGSTPIEAALLLKL
jgi:ankyrin repeat protein